MTTAVREGGRRAGSTRSATRASRVSVTALTGGVSAIILGVLAFTGGWTRRWISDDGLIVLRTVRNLLAGNGPVFNAGERVEANTSTLWQYLIYLVALVTDARLEIIAMWLALILTTIALAAAAWGTTLLHRRHRALVLLPVGGLVYLALPPARDFATSGLEWGLSVCWIAVMWLLLMTWAQPARPVGRHQAGGDRDLIVYGVAAWAGLSWLVRPELALYGGLVGLLLLFAARSWRVRGLILAAALPIPAAYQIFRMGYYGLITPHTAVAKSAGDAQWAEGWDYLRDLADPYHLWVALALVLAVAAVMLWRLSVSDAPPAASADDRSPLRTPAVGVVLILLAGTLHLLYVLRVGGDFMHGRMLLLPIFALLLPLAVVPVIDLTHPRRIFDVLLGAGVVAVSWWGIATVIDGHELDWETEYEGDLGIVDERDFWAYATFREQGDPPLVAEDFRSALAMNDYVDTATRTVDEDAALMYQFRLDQESYSWGISPRPAEPPAEDPSGLSQLPPTVYHLNLGMTSMNAPLELRVLDTVGLTTPLAARQPRDPDARVGHDKWLPFDWQAADTATALEDLPPWYDSDAVAKARQALQTPEMAELFATYRAPMTMSRFLDNLAFSLTAGRTLEFSLDADEVIEDFGPTDPAIPVAWPMNINAEPRR